MDAGRYGKRREKRERERRQKRDKMGGESALLQRAERETRE